MPRVSRLEYSDVQAVIDAGTQEMDWVSHELEGVNLSDKRLDRRLIKTAQQLSRSPVSPINEACGDWASTQAAYRLFDNEKATFERILASHAQATRRRVAEQPDTGRPDSLAHLAAPDFATEDSTSGCASPERIVT